MRRYCEGRAIRRHPLRIGRVLHRLAALVAAATLLGGCFAALGGDHKPDPASLYTGWLHASAGASFGDTVLLDDVSLDTVTPLVGFGIGAHYRLPRLDVGALVEAHGGQRFAGPNRHGPLGSAFRAAAVLRWRYIEESWGAVFMRLAPGFMVLGHSDALRTRVGVLVGRDMAAVDDHSVAFSLGLDFGLIINLTERVALSMHLDLVTATTSLATPVRDVSYNSVRGLFMAGLEWRM